MIYYYIVIRVTTKGRYQTYLNDFYYKPLQHQYRAASVWLQQGCFYTITTSRNNLGASDVSQMLKVFGGIIHTLGDIVRFILFILYE